MPRRQTGPAQWLVVTEDARGGILKVAARLPLGSGILLLSPVGPADMRRLRHIAAARALKIVEESRGAAARVHNLRELRRALLAGTDLLFLSPIFATASHPDWQPVPRMRAAAFARLGRRTLVALGGMDAKRYARVARLGFSGWAGISAFRT